MTTATLPTVSTLPLSVRCELAFIARRDRVVNPRGEFDKKSRWYPDTAAEGATPAVRSPSVSWSYSYMVACRTKKHVAQLPEATLNEDAAAGLTHVLAGYADLTKKSMREIAKI